MSIEVLGFAPTTYGSAANGGFGPALKIGSTYYVKRGRRYQNEDDAAAVAQLALSYISRRVVAALRDGGFEEAANWPNVPLK